MPQREEIWILFKTITFSPVSAQHTKSQDINSNGDLQTIARHLLSDEMQRINDS